MYRDRCSSPIWSTSSILPKSPSVSTGQIATLAAITLPSRADTPPSMLVGKLVRLTTSACNGLTIFGRAFPYRQYDLDRQ